MLPMMGFGFMDNIIMIQAGEYIDTTIGVVFGLSTLTAAAFGQVFSDVGGVIFGGIVTGLASKLGIDRPGFTSEQSNLPNVQWVGVTGRIIGVICGCFFGMSSLLLIDLEMSQRLRRFNELQPILVTLVNQAKRSLRADSCKIYMLGISTESFEEILYQVGVQIDDNNSSEKKLINNSLKVFANHFNQKLSDTSYKFPRLIKQKYTEEPILSTLSDWIVSESGPDILNNKVIINNNLNEEIINKEKPLVNETIVHYVTRTGKAVLCVQKKEENPKTVFCYPVFDDIDKYRVIGVIEITNKKSMSGELIPFTRDDERLIKMLSEHLSLYLALGSHYNHTANTALATVEEIGWLCKV